MAGERPGFDNLGGRRFELDCSPGGLGLGVRSGRSGWRASRYGSILAGIWLITPWQDQRKGENAGEHETGKALGPAGFSGRKRCRS